jgi:outer membrane lipoprotein SlyB
LLPEDASIEGDIEATTAKMPSGAELGAVSGAALGLILGKRGGNGLLGAAAGGLLGALAGALLGSIAEGATEAADDAVAALAVDEATDDAANAPGSGASEPGALPEPA